MYGSAKAGVFLLTYYAFGNALVACVVCPCIANEYTSACSTRFVQTRAKGWLMFERVCVCVGTWHAMQSLHQAAGVGQSLHPWLPLLCYMVQVNP